MCKSQLVNPFPLAHPRRGKGTFKSIYLANEKHRRVSEKFKRLVCSLFPASSLPVSSRVWTIWTA